MSKIKKKDLIKQIKEEVDLIEVRNMSADIINKVNPVVIKKEEKKSFLFVLRLAPVMLIVLIFSVGIFFLFKDSNPTHTQGSVSKPHQTFGIQAVTLFNFASNDPYQNLSLTRSIRKKQLNNTINQDYEKIANEINEYLFSAAGILQKNNVEFTEETSDDIRYQTKMIIKVKMFDIEKSYILYFNETSEVDYDDIDEVSSEIVGIIKTTDKELLLEGKKEVEPGEQEVTLRMYLNENKSEYYEISQEIENKENEFSYSYFKNNQVLEEIEISVEENNLGKFIEMEVLEGTNEIELEFKYDEKFILVEYEINDYKGNVEVYIEEKYNLYKFNEKNITIYQ